MSQRQLLFTAFAETVARRCGCTGDSWLAHWNLGQCVIQVAAMGPCRIQQYWDKYGIASKPSRRLMDNILIIDLHHIQSTLVCASGSLRHAGAHTWFCALQARSNKKSCSLAGTRSGGSPWSEYIILGMAGARKETLASIPWMQCAKKVQSMLLWANSATILSHTDCAGSLGTLWQKWNWHAVPFCTSPRTWTSGNSWEVTDISNTQQTCVSSTWSYRLHLLLPKPRNRSPWTCAGRLEGCGRSSKSHV